MIKFLSLIKICEFARNSHSRSPESRIKKSHGKRRSSFAFGSVGTRLFLFEESAHDLNWNWIEIVVIRLGSTTGVFFTLLSLRCSLFTFHQPMGQRYMRQRPVFSFVSSIHLQDLPNSAQQENVLYPRKEKWAEHSIWLKAKLFDT